MNVESFVYVHVVTYNNKDTIGSCLASLLGQEGVHSMRLCVTDNASQDGTVAEIVRLFGASIEVRQNLSNIGFAAAHNRGITEALRRGAAFVFIANPDLKLEQGALQKLVQALQNDRSAGVSCPKLFRADSTLQPHVSGLLDSTGMYITPAVRHFDRGSNEQDTGRYDGEEYVFGASGAAMLLRAEFIRDVILPGGTEDSLRLFDPLFFAYREDADLAWRGQWYGWKCRYVPAAVGWHMRVVLPSRRRSLAPELNAYSVRNRFLLQLNNFSLAANYHCLAPMLWRNLLVLMGAASIERSSLPALRAAWNLKAQAARNRAYLRKRRRIHPFHMSRWFSFRPYAEPALAAPCKADKPVQRVLAVVANFNSGGCLMRCLQSLSDSIADFKLSVKVLDNASHDKSAEESAARYKKEDFRFVFSPDNLGFAGAINTAAANEEYDALLVLNPDVELEPGCVAALAHVLDAYPEIGAVAPVLRGPDGCIQFNYTIKAFPTLGSTLAELFGLHFVWKTNPWTVRFRLTENPLLRAYLEGTDGQPECPGEDPARPLLVPQPAAACLLIRADAFRAAGGFDETFYPAWFEDVDFCRRLRDCNVNCAVFTGAKARHSGAHSLQSLDPGEFEKMWYLNMLRYWKKHGSKAEYFTVRAALPIALVLRALSISLLPSCRRQAGAKQNSGKVLFALASRLLAPITFKSAANEEKR